MAEESKGSEATKADGMSLGTPLFDAVPPDVMSDIVAFLPGPNVARLAGVSRGWKSLVDDKTLWAKLYERAFRPGVGARVTGSLRRAGSSADPRTQYKQRYNRHKSRTLAHRRQREQRVARHKRQLRQRKCLVAQGCLQFPLAIGTPWALILTTMLFVGMRLDRDIDWSFATIMIPVWIMVAISVLSVVCICIARGNQNSPDGLFGRQYESRYEFLAYEMVSELWYDSNKALLFAAAGTVVGITQLVLLTLKLDGLDVGWAIVFIPTFLLLAMSCCTPCFEWFGIDRPSEGVPIYIMATAAICVFVPVFVMLALVLDGTDIALYYVLLPLLIVGGLIVCGGCITAVALARDVRHREFGRKMEAVGVVCLGILVFFPWITWEILTILKVQGVLDATWMEVLSPLYLWLSLLALAGLVLCTMLSLQMRSRLRQDRLTMDRELARDANNMV